MDNLLGKKQKLISNIIYASLVFSLVYILGLGIGLKLNIILQILIVFLGSAIVKFFLLNPLILYAILAASLLSAILVHRFITPILFTLGDRVFYLFENIIGNLQGKENITSDNILLFWGMLIILVSFFTAFILFKGKNIYLLLPVYIGSFLFYWYNFYDKAYWMISIFLLVFFVLMGLNKYFDKRMQAESSSNYDFEKLYTPWLKTIFWYSLLIIFIAIFLPKSDSFLHWPWLQQKVYNTFPNVENLRSANGQGRKSGEATLFDFSITGYQEDNSRLGGPVRLSDKKIMTVQTDSGNYLRGNVKHTYTGYSWESITEPSKKYELRQDFSNLSLKEKRYYYNQTYITITNHAFASITLFSPYKATEVSFKGNHKLIVNRDDTLIFPNGIFDGESYTVQVQKPLPYKILLSLGLEQNKESIDDLEIYLQIPADKITERTKTLVEEIVKNKNSDFQKAVAIENYLRNNYRYNLDVNGVPDNKDFIDYFLFDIQEGYCTYYATSMSIMLRLAGIPSRYIEGYLAQDQEEPGIYVVRHKDAHAWVEAFIEPVGWMSFEPTPAYPIQHELDDYIVNETNEKIYLGESNWNRERSRIDFEDDIDEGGYNGIDDEKSSNYYNPNKSMSIKLPKIVLDMLVTILISIIPIRFLIGLSMHKYEETKAKKLSNNKRIIYLYKRIIKIMEFLGCPQQYGETHYEYANRVAYKFYIHNEKGIKEITEIFVKSKYGNLTTSDDDVLILESYRETLEKRLRNHYGPIAYYYRKYVKTEYMRC